MKKIVKLSLITLSIAGLAGCSTFGWDSKDASSAQSDSSQAAEQTASSASADSTSTAAVSDPTAKISLKKNDQDQIIATIYTSYNNNPQGSVKLQWKAPEGSNCYDTSFPITKYGDKNDKTWASVEIKQGDKYCTGKWTANVVYKDSVLASDSLTV
jgi:surface antigen